MKNSFFRRTGSYLPVLFFSIVLILSVSVSKSIGAVYDDFNGGQINSTLWDIQNPGGVLSQSGGLLNANGPPTSIYGVLSSTHIFRGDFESVLDYRDFQSTATVFTENCAQIWLQVTDDIFRSENFIYIFRGYCPSGHTLASGGKINGVGLGNIDSPASSASGVLKISRTGSTITTHYNEGAGWVTHRTFTNAFTGDVAIQIAVYTGDNGTFHVSSDWITYEGQMRTPAPRSFNNPVNTPLRIQFSQSMNTSSTWIELVEEDEIDIAGTVQWSQTFIPNDTLTFTPNNALKPATHYAVEGNAVAQNGWQNFFGFAFITKPSTADATPPTVQTVYPYNGATGVSTTTEVLIKFSETMNPPSIEKPGNITLAGPGISGPADYSVSYDWNEGGVEIRKNTPFSPFSTYTVTITTNVRDLRLNPLKNQYKWSFTTGASDTTPPTVTQTIPAASAEKVSEVPVFHVIFSEEMDSGTLTTANISLYNINTSSVVPVNVYWQESNVVMFGSQSALTRGHQYRVTLGTGIKDLAGNSLASSYIWTFTVAGSGVDSAPVIHWGAGIGSQLGIRWWHGETNLWLELGASDDLTDPLTVTATAPGKSWILTKPPGSDEYSYESAVDEGLSSGPHTLTFTIRDGASPQNTVTFQTTIFIFDASPSLSSPSNGAAGVSTTPTFEWTYGGALRPSFYGVYVVDGPNPDTANTIWRGYRADSGSGTQSVTIPEDKKLKPNTTYYWAVGGINFEDTGDTYSDVRSFTTGGAPIPSPPFPRVRGFVRSDDRLGGMQWNARASTPGLSPADIAELKVEGPGGFRSIFTEDNISQGEQFGLYFMQNGSGSLPDGTYTFTLTDSLGRTATYNYDFANPATAIPRVSASSMLPVNNSFSISTTPTFQWGSIGTGDYYYRVRVMDWNSRMDAVYVSPPIQDTQFTVPSGYLMANTSYKWRVEVFDGVDEQSIRFNRSVSEAFNFFTGPPGLDLVWGTITADNEHYMGPRASLNALVRGAFPSNMTQLGVTGPSSFSYDFVVDNVGYNFMVQGNFYGASAMGYPPNGDYTFTAQVTGGSDVYNKTGQGTNPIPIVDQSSMLPSNNAYLTSFTPTFSWSLVSGSPRYYRIVISSWKTNYTIYQSTRTLDQSSFTIPAGILKANQSYKWRVQVYDDQDGLVAENSSNSGWNAFTIVRPKNIVDFDGEGKTDIAVYRAETGAWYVYPSGGGSPYGFGWGGDASDKPAPGDYDGDGKTDIAVYRGATGAWYVYPSGGGAPYGFGWGGDATDKPAPGDYDGDGKTDIAVYRTNTGAWYVYPSGGGAPYGFGWGGDTTDKPAPGDYDGDGKTDIAVYRSETGAWYVYPSGGGAPYGFGWGGDTSDKPAPGDYDGDGRTDIAVYRNSTGAWYVYPSGGGAPYGRGWGGDASDKPAPGDYDGDGKTDCAVYRTTTGAWYVYPSGGGAPYGLGWGGDATDKPVTLNLSAIE